MPWREKLLIDWDYGACGLWRITPPEEVHAPRPPGLVLKLGSPPGPRPRPFERLLSAWLLDDLQAWNDLACEIFHYARSPEQIRQTDAEPFWTTAAHLANCVQAEVDDTHEVLYIVPGGAWRWVNPPSPNQTPYS